mmetsp:Transcript_29827/g.45513  ORF Transcript_29827/g.45513 Transcript_29827/m.45513 type:complete len:96 (+) Transcript_29827:1177-1464(+)
MALPNGIIIDPEAKHSNFEWQSAGTLRVDLQKLEKPSRWRRLYFERVKNMYKTSKTWWDIHEKHRKDLVRHQPFPEDTENLDDLLDEITSDKLER